MSDLLAAVGVALVFEGLLWAAAPQLGLKLLSMAAETPEQVLRLTGAVALMIGLGIVWAIRG
jgi:uncharacterized protein YjeT (DUF2065 family)